HQRPRTYPPSLHDALPILMLRTPEPPADEENADGGRQEEGPRNLDPRPGVGVGTGNPVEKTAKRLVGVEGRAVAQGGQDLPDKEDRKSTRLNSSHVAISYA